MLDMYVQFTMHHTQFLLRQSIICLLPLNSVFGVQDFPVREVLKDGENVLKVNLLSPVLYASERRKAHSAYRVPPECPPDVQKGECHVNFIRKVNMFNHVIFLHPPLTSMIERVSSASF